MGRLLIRVNEEQASKPIAAQIIIEHKVHMAILSAHINNKGGEILVEIPDDIETKIAEAFRRRGVIVTVPKLIQINTEKCFSCSTCTALCPVEAINIDKEDTVQFDKEKCLGNTCGICVDACPVRAIKFLRTNNRDQNKERES
ncbi:MAG: 4Fe-4S dicluster domain-containing protein [Nitrososphaerota archaeon]|jgi:Fe-S-cluster-containing hydrogenase component 2|nr:4Fe-4S dicluster domain-containing protein [Nitrososphaerota archaeon]